ncbi:MAG: tyrosine-type recombinase/integrase [Prevotellaceae bacterium]|jgi:site-specific recombinase XerD|nr:tyrosine-type recombinase/integrase [Prevotellaceae bacterium]
MVKKFQKFLEKNELADNTIQAYVWTVNNFLMFYEKINKGNLLAYKGWMIEHYKPQTVNSRIQALNKFLEFLRRDRLKLKFIRVQHKNFLENVISNADYVFFKNRLKNDGLIEWYFIVWFLTATGARISELVQIKAEHVEAGYIDMYSKSGKVRRLYIPKILRNEATDWLKCRNISLGYIFQNSFSEQISPRAIGRQLKIFAAQYGMNTKVIYPHSFRHRFAKNFLEKFNDISLLADLMGHKSIETTRIYLRRTAGEQQKLIDRIVTW